MPQFSALEKVQNFLWFFALSVYVQCIIPRILDQKTFCVKSLNVDTLKLLWVRGSWRQDRISNVTHTVHQMLIRILMLYSQVWVIIKLNQIKPFECLTCILFSLQIDWLIVGVNEYFKPILTLFRHYIYIIKTIWYCRIEKVGCTLTCLCVSVRAYVCVSERGTEVKTSVKENICRERRRKDREIYISSGITDLWLLLQIADGQTDRRGLWHILSWRGQECKYWYVQRQPREFYIGTFSPEHCALDITCWSINLVQRKKENFKLYYRLFFWGGGRGLFCLGNDLTCYCYWIPETWIMMCQIFILTGNSIIDW